MRTTCHKGYTPFKHGGCARGHPGEGGCPSSRWNDPYGRRRVLHDASRYSYPREHTSGPVWLNPQIFPIGNREKVVVP
jgi:hypothetical protein